jgi:type 1 glutamine amidotransferase
MLLSLVTMLLVACSQPTADGAPVDATVPIRVLILTGRNNHNWRETTPALQGLLETDGRCSVDTTEPPRGLTEENLQHYDIILSNWNSWGAGSQEAEALWTDAVRDAYLGFVRGGGGHVTVHAGGSTFYESWPEYRQVALVCWDLGTTGHGRPHEFKVRFDRPDHPVTAGLEPFVIRDELWNRPGIAAGATVLASAYSDKQNEPQGTDRWEVSAVVARYGQGRCFATLLGHDAQTMQNPGFQRLLIQGVQWAAGQTSSSPRTP